jgi:hypothetical protein
MNPIAALKRHFENVERSRQLLEEIREGVANLTDVTNRHLIKLAELMELAIEQANDPNSQTQPAEIGTPGATVPQSAPMPELVGDH